jgi:hypothetical protein
MSMSSYATRRFFCPIAAATLFVSCSNPSKTQQQTSKPSSSTTTGGAPAAPAVATSGINETVSAPMPRETAGDAWRDADSIKALDRMSAYLRTLKTFQVRSEMSRDEVLDNDQTIAFAGIVDLLVERPSRLRAQVTSDKQQRMYFYDGKSFTLWAQRVNYYATVPAPSTLRALVDTLADKYNIEMPLADLFYWGERHTANELQSAVDIGPSQIGGVTCEHYAFRQEGADWQVWIQQGDYPLPRKLVITTTTDEARPQYTSVMTWNLAPSFNDAAFVFVPPKDAQRIAFAINPAGAVAQ